MNNRKPETTPRDILKKRAQKLAQKEKKPDTRQHIQLVRFRLADEQYGVPCVSVREVYPLRQLTPVPGAPGFIMGIINVRGEIVSVVDLKRFFDIPLKGLTDMTRVIVLHHRETRMTFGIMAEEVLGTVSVAQEDILPPLPTLTGIRSEYLQGVAKDRLIVLDADKLLTDPKMIVHQEVD